MAIVFPGRDEGNPNFPLPPDFQTLTDEGKRLARVNAVSLGGTPQLEVESWQYFREYYLKPDESGWYSGGFVESPPAHADWIRQWYINPRLIMACPRGTCKSTITLEDIMRKLLTTPHWECALVLASQKFCTSRLGQIAKQLEHNKRIRDDFGIIRPKRGQGVWNRGSVLETCIGSKISAGSITGGLLGTRPSGLLVLDDVEKAKDLVIEATDLREHFHSFFFNALLPMANRPGSTIPLRIIGTLYSRKMFIHWLSTTQDPEVINYFHRVRMNIYDMKWDAMGADWIDRTRRSMPASAFSAQYLNEPTTDEDRMLRAHPQLTAYHVEGKDEAYSLSPLDSSAVMVTHKVNGYQLLQNVEGAMETVPKVEEVRRPLGVTARKMYRFITVDYAPTISELSDFSAIHVLGMDNTSEHPNTLVSLDAWMGKVPRSTLVRLIAEYAIKWRCPVVAVEAYPLQMEMFERFHKELEPIMQDRCQRVGMDAMPAVVPLKFPHQYSKSEKIKTLVWRFEQYRIQIPNDRMDELAYKALNDQIELCTPDLALLEHDDILDTLAMSSAMGKQYANIPLTSLESHNPETQLKQGVLVDPETGTSNFESVAAAGRLTDSLVDAMMEARDEARERENQYGEETYVWLDTLY
jgi:hypothetical protein